MRLAALFSALLVAAMIAGCGTHTTRPSTTDGTRPLLAPATLGSDRAANQIVRGALGERELTMNCVVTVKDGAMTVVGLSAMGVRLFTLKYDGTSTSVDSVMAMPPQLTPERLLADLQLVFWPVDTLKQPLATAGWQVSEPTSGTRRLRHGPQLITEVHYASADPWTGRSWLVNLEHGYTLNIDSRGM